MGGVSEHSVGISAIVSLRADHWLGRRHHITSPMMCLAEALEAHAKVLHARSSSWKALRAEWVSFMIRKQRSMKAGMSMAEAQLKADAARQSVLKQQLRRTVSRAVKMLEQERRRTAAARRKETRKNREDQRQKKLIAAKVQRLHRQNLKIRLQWSKSRD